VSWLQTFTGKRIDLFAPKAEQIEIEDIAHALAHECRYAGHVKEFYSVAQHSVIVSRLCEPQDALWGLLHDGAEAYLGDVVKPLKVTGAFAAFREMEMRMQLAICSRFGLPPKEPGSVKRIDKAMVAIEARDLLAPLLPDWKDRTCLLDIAIRAQDPCTARASFLDRFYELREGFAPTARTPLGAACGLMLQEGNLGGGDS
jgi:hypothetical protein